MNDKLLQPTAMELNGAQPSEGSAVRPRMLMP